MKIICFSRVKEIGSVNRTESNTVCVLTYLANEKALDDISVRLILYERRLYKLQKC